MKPFHRSAHDQPRLTRSSDPAGSLRRRARPPWWGPLLGLMLVVSMLAAGYPPSGGVAHAAGTTYPPADLLNFTLLSICNSRVQLGVPEAGLYCATPAQIQSLKNLQQAAISATLADFNLPASDAAAVQTWGRNEALAELWGLLMQAIQTPACTSSQTPGSGCRSTDQQNAVDWLTAMFRKQAVQAADDAGLEYVKWAGLDQTAFSSDVAQYNADQSAGNSTTQDETNLQNLLSGSPVNYNNGGSFTNYKASTGGYCVYQSPAPFQSEYTSNIFATGASATTPQDCFTPCTNVFGCTPPTPSYDQFTKWGEADVSNQLFDTADFVTTAHWVSVVASLAAASVAAGIAAGLLAGMTAAVGGALVTAGLASAVFPFALTGALVGIAAASAALIVAIVVVAIVIAVLQGITIANAAKLPGQLASLIEGAPTNTPDLNAALKDSNQTRGLFSLFLGATLPSPRMATCDNSLPVVGSGSIPAQCMNAPPIPAPSNTDPNFAIQAKGSTTTVDATTLSWKDATTNLTHTARLSGNWFVDQQTDSSGTTSTVQTLHIHYTDWSGTGQNAWLVHDPTNGYKFLGIADQSSSSTTFNASTCLTDKTCSSSSSIQYVGPDGKDYTASVVPPALPVVAPTTSPHPLEGSPVQFAANGSSPDASVTLSYRWKFEQPGGGITCAWDPTTASFQCSSGSWSAPVSGPSASYTWPTSGTFHVQLTATDSLGRSTVDTFPVTVGDVPPQLALSAAGPSGPGCASASTTNQPHCLKLGTTTQLDGSITHAGSADSEVVRIDWGDGNSDYNQIGGSTIVVGSAISMSVPSATQVTFSGSHRYTNPGHYTAKVTVTDQSGATVSTTTAETIWDSTTVTFPAITPITYGTPLSATQLDATISADGWNGTVSGTVTYHLDGPAGPAVTLGQVLPAGDHTLYVQFQPTDPDLFPPPPEPSQDLRVNQVPLTITASSPSVTYTGAVPAITPSYSGFIPGESAASLTTLPTCSSTAPASGAAGGYATSCAGAVDTNYSISYQGGTLTIAPAGTGSSISSSARPAMVGQPVTFTATVSVTAPGAGTPTGTVDFFDGATKLGSGTLATSGGVTTGTLTTSTLALGSHRISASYHGDGNFTGSTASALTQYVDTNLSGYPKLSNGAYNLSHAQLKGAYLVQANLAGATISYANLSGADLSNANLSGADLTNANLSNTILSGANLSGANLTQTNLMAATGMGTATLTGVIWSKTTCPDTTNSSRDGGTCLGHL